MSMLVDIRKASWTPGMGGGGVGMPVGEKDANKKNFVPPKSTYSTSPTG